jgi:UDP-N-acetylmuramate dehydrogenase
MLMSAQPALPPGTAAALKEAFGSRLECEVTMARFTSARVGGPADYWFEAHSVDELAWAANTLWQLGAPFIVLGGGSNVLVSDAGFRGVVVHNQARQVQFEHLEGVSSDQQVTVLAEAGANFGALARQAAALGLAGLEWAAGIPGTVGGAVAGNAGAHGGDVAGSLVVANILHWNRSRPDEPAGEAVREIWPVEKFEYGYRTSRLKRSAIGRWAPHPQPAWVVLEARFGLIRSNQAETQAKIEVYNAYRRRTQPPGASLGSMFKNPPRSVSTETAGQLIDKAGLKGARQGAAEISTLHGNFFINHGDATALDIYHLIDWARRTVYDRFGVQLELEIELVGSWDFTGASDQVVN